MPAAKTISAATFGGPVRIPHLYDGHNKTFFFFSFEGFRSVLPAPSAGTFTTVPNAADTAGDFSADLGAQVNCGGSPVQRRLGKSGVCGADLRPAERWQRTAIPGSCFPNNTIPKVPDGSYRSQDPGPSAESDQQSPVQQLPVVGNHSPAAELPSVKVDHNVSPSLKLSTFYSYVGGSGQTSTDGLPVEHHDFRLQHQRIAARRA